MIIRSWLASIYARLTKFSARSIRRSRRGLIRPHHATPGIIESLEPRVMLFATISGIETAALPYVLIPTSATPPVPITASISIAEGNTNLTNLTGATITIGGAFDGTRDILTFSSIFNIKAAPGGFNTGTGTLTLQGSDTIADYVTALKSVMYSAKPGTPVNATLNVTFQVFDADGASNSSARQINLIDGRPSIGGMSGGVTYQDHTGFIYPLNFSSNLVTVSPGLTITDADTTLASNQTAVSQATVTVVDSWNSQSSKQDWLSATQIGNIQPS